MREFNRGDTLVEVLLGVTIFSLVAVIALETMNRGMAIAQYSLETTLVRQQVDAQAEMLRYAHDMKNDTSTNLIILLMVTKNHKKISPIPRLIHNLSIDYTSWQYSCF